jgi:hypothetical protein
MSIDADAGAKNLTVMMKVKTANHSLDRDVMGVRVPMTSVRLAVNDARRGRQPHSLHFGKKSLVQPAIALDSPECRLP